MSNTSDKTFKTFNDVVNDLVARGVPQNDAIESARAAYSYQGQVPEQEENFSILGSTENSEEERLVTGIALVPNKVDFYGTMFPESTVKRTAHNFMRKYRQGKFMHLINLTDDDVELVESYIAPVELKIEGRNIKKGTWVVVFHVKSEKLWKHIKENNITGFSIGAKVTKGMVGIEE